MLKLLFKSKDILYQVSSDLGEINRVYSSFSDAGQKAPSPAFQMLKKACLGHRFKKIANFTGKLLQNYKTLDCEIFGIILKHVSDDLSVFFQFA